MVVEALEQLPPAIKHEQQPLPAAWLPGCGGPLGGVLGERAVRPRRPLGLLVDAHVPELVHEVLHKAHEPVQERRAVLGEAFDLDVEVVERHLRGPVLWSSHRRRILTVFVFCGLHGDLLQWGLLPPRAALVGVALPVLLLGRRFCRGSLTSSRLLLCLVRVGVGLLLRNKQPGRGALVAGDLVVERSLGAADLGARALPKGVQHRRVLLHQADEDRCEGGAFKVEQALGKCSRRCLHPPLVGRVYLEVVAVGRMEAQ
mmetsp:Transcript_1004/g.2386  ORF Transcript_1004/g.2386 Transcript_1004/m.2386 type:complete len:258 (-) Transcript_1004:23-796(-)